MTNTWQDYYERTKNNPPRPLLVKAIPFVLKKDSALDLGSGALNDATYLLSEGFKKVVAVDKETVAKDRASTLPKDRFIYVISKFEDFDFLGEKFDLINAQYSLPFINPNSFDGVFKKIIDSLTDGGVFVGQFFGDRDEWKSDLGMTFHSLKETEDLLSEFETIYLNEEEADKSMAAGGMKHWHVFYFIVRKLS